MPALPPIRIGISACLLGERVRYDGGHKRDPFLTEILGAHVQWIPVCPEVEVGMGTPREPVNLVRSGSKLLMIAARSGLDYTDAMNGWARARVEALCREDLSGYVLKSKSPSCGKRDVSVRQASGVPEALPSRGLFAAVLMARMPWLPVEDESRLGDQHVRDNFIERVFAYRRLNDLFASSWTIASLLRFHAANRLALSVHSRGSYGKLEALLLGAGSEIHPSELRERYERGFMATLSRPATRSRQAAILREIAGELSPRLDAGASRSLRETIAEYRRGHVPIAVPIALVRELARSLGVAWLASQSYIEADPREVALRSHV